MINKRNLKTLTLAALLAFPLCSFAQTKATARGNRANISFSQKHSRTVESNLYADGIKIKKDLSLINKAQEERVANESEIPADDLYGNVWNNRYVNAYRGMKADIDSFRVDLSNYSMPSMGYVTSHFGPRGRRMHYGIDLKVQVGDTIRSTFDGKVRVCEYEGRGYGYFVVVRHKNGLETVYGHLSEFLVSEDDVVKAGQAIALGGNTGRSTGPHLHFETRFLGKPINPAAIFDFSNKTTHRKSYFISSSSFSYPESSRGIAYENSKKYSKSKKNKYSNGSVKYHKIKKGDTVESIARKYKVNPKKISSLNSMNGKSKLKAGKAIRIS